MCSFMDNEGPCDYKSKHRTSVRSHVVKHVENIFYCTPCGMYAKSFYGHGKTHHQEGPKLTTEQKLLASDFYCVQCDKKFTTKQGLQYHNQTVHAEDGGKKYLCDMCDFKAVRKALLREHIQVKHTIQELIPCHICAKGFSSKKSVQTHILNAHSDGSFTCEYCSAEFKANLYLRQHLKKMHMERKFCCDSCGKKFVFQAELDRHFIQVHTDIRNFACSECEMKFSTEKKLKHHEDVHGSPKFSCDDCGKLFRQRHSLSRHRLTHTGEKPYMCNTCNFQCTQSNDLKKHYLNVHKTDIGRVSKEVFGNTRAVIPAAAGAAVPQPAAMQATLPTAPPPLAAGTLPPPPWNLVGGS